MDKINAKVAKILDSRQLVLNRGLEHKIKKGMIFAILEEIEVIDPDTRKSIGKFDVEKVRVIINQVYELFSVGKTFETYSTLDDQITAGSLVSTMESLSATRKYYQIRESSKSNNTDLTGRVIEISIGDNAILVEENKKHLE